MYLQITTRCNMTCDHCCYSCNRQGEDMSMEVLDAALEYNCGYVTIGGGEPTLHKHFEKILFKVMGHDCTEDTGVFVITNGTHKERSLALLQLAKKEVVGAELSTDHYHDLDMIPDDVWHAYQELGFTRDVTADGTRPVSATGRAAKEIPAGDTTRDLCVCEDMIIKPNGDVYQCGCDDAPLLGNVLTSAYLEGEHGCHKEIAENL